MVFYGALFHGAMKAITGVPQGATSSQLAAQRQTNNTEWFSAKGPNFIRVYVTQLHFVYVPSKPMRDNVEL